MCKRILIMTTLSLIAYSYRHRIIKALHTRPPPYNEHIARWKRHARIIGLMHLAGNKPGVAV